jgi:hypothetical protein
MLKSITAVIVAATIAAGVTVLSAPTGHVDAGPLVNSAEAGLIACTHRPWPYFNCVGTPLGNPNIRLVTTDQLTL